MKRLFIGIMLSAGFSGLWAAGETCPLSDAPVKCVRTEGTRHVIGSYYCTASSLEALCAYLKRGGESLSDSIAKIFYETGANSRTGCSVAFDGKEYHANNWPLQYYPGLCTDVMKSICTGESPDYYRVQDMRDMKLLERNEAPVQFHVSGASRSEVGVLAVVAVAYLLGQVVRRFQQAVE